MSTDQQLAQQMRREVKGLCVDCGITLSEYALKQTARGYDPLNSWHWDLCARCFKCTIS